MMKRKIVIGDQEAAKSQEIRTVEYVISRAGEKQNNWKVVSEKIKV